MLAASLELEVDEYIAAVVDQLDERGRRLVNRNGHARPRTMTTVAGAVEVRAPGGQRPARRCGYRGAEAVPLVDRAAVVP